jgi:hypothetical protein
MPFDQYANYVGSQGFNLVNLVTEMRFDEDATVGKLFFRPVKFLEEEESQIATRQKDTPAAKNAVVMTVAQTDGVTKKALPFLKAPPKAEAVEAVEEIAEPKKKAEKKAEPTPKKDIADVLGKWSTSDEE